MDFKFSYLPVTGPLSGKSFEDQTARAINEAGQIACDAERVSQQASADSRRASKDAGNALEKANEAFSTANRALEAGQSSGQTASAALKSAESAQETASEASSKADQAIENMGEVREIASQALERGDEAKVIATANSTKINQVNVMAELARDTSEQALNAARTGIYYKPTDEVMDLDELLDPVSLLINNDACVNLPVAERSFLTVRADENDTGVIQIVQTQNNVVYTRTGTITSSEVINAGTDTVSLVYQSFETVSYELDIESGKTPGNLSVTRFTGKSHALSDASPTALTGQFIFEQDAFNDGSLTVNGIPLVDISLGNMTLTYNPVVTEHGVIRAIDALLDGQLLELTISFEWTDIATVATAVFTGWNQLATQAALDTKQDTLTFDAMPTAGSTNPVTSGGVKAAIEWAISTVYKWKGSVDAVADLPLKDNELGDVYNVRSSGANYGWTGTEWDNLGGIEAVDAAPVKDSGFPVASGGVFDAIKGVSAALDEAVRLSPDAKNELIRKDNGLYATTPVSSGADNLIKYKDDGLCAELPEYLKGMFTLVHAVTVSSEFNKPDAICSRVRLPELIEEYGDALRILVLDGNDRGVWAVNDPSDWTPVDIDTAYVYCLNRFDRAIYSSFDGIGWKAMMAHFLFSDLLDKPVTLKGYGISDAPTKTELETGLAGKQNTLSFDSTPTAGSSNPVTSDGVKAYVDAAFGDLDAFLEDILS